IFRFRYANNKVFEKDFSYAIAKDFKASAKEVTLREENDFYEIVTEQLRCQIFKQDLKKKILNKEDKVVNEDEKGFHWEETKDTGNNIVIDTKWIQSGE